MDLSTLFSYVPLIGAQNILQVTDNDSGLKVPFLASLGTAAAAWVPKNAVGDDGNNPAPGSVASFTSTDPKGRAGNMITHLEVIGEGDTDIGEIGTLLSLVLIPSGEKGLLGNGYSLSAQPPAGSFDMSSFLPRVDAKGKPSLYGSADSYTFFPGTPTGRFPTAPRTRAYTAAAGYSLMYIPPSFFSNINTILNDLLGFTAFNVTAQTPNKLYGAMLVAAQYAVTDDSYPLLGAGDLTVDFSHSGTN
jgi:hypothetical protein